MTQRHDGAPSARRILILHESDGRPYYAAVHELCDAHDYALEYKEISVLRWLVRKLRHGLITSEAISQACTNLLFRLAVPWVTNRDIILGIAPFNIRLVWYALLARNNNVIYHTSCHLWLLENAPWRYGIATPWLMRFWRRFLSTSSNATIVCVTEHAEQTLRKFLERPGAADLPRIRTIPHSVDIEVFKPPISRPRERGLSVLFVGRLVQEKGLITILSVARKMPELFPTRFTIVGDGPMFGELVRQTSEIPNVELRGRINDRAGLASLYREHDVFLLPSIRIPGGWEELFGVVLIEAMASGLIAIASDHIGPREIIQSGVNGFLVPENDPEDIVKVLASVQIDSSRTDSIRESGRRTAQRYSTHSVAKQWQAVLK